MLSLYYTSIDIFRRIHEFKLHTLIHEFRLPTTINLQSRAKITRQVSPMEELSLGGFKSDVVMDSHRHHTYLTHPQAIRTLICSEASQLAYLKLLKYFIARSDFRDQIYLELCHYDNQSKHVFLVMLINGAALYIATYQTHRLYYRTSLPLDFNFYRLMSALYYEKLGCSPVLFLFLWTSWPEWMQIGVMK